MNGYEIALQSKGANKKKIFRIKKNLSKIYALYVNYILLILLQFVVHVVRLLIHLFYKFG